MNRQLSRRVLTLLAALSLLGGCGGGGGGGGGGLVFALLSIAPNTFAAQVATAFAITAQNAGDPGAATIRFTATAGTPFNSGTTATLDVAGQVESATRITGTSPVTDIAAQVVARVTVILAGNENAQLAATVTFDPPPPPPPQTPTRFRVETGFTNLAETPAGQPFTLGSDGFTVDFDGNVFTKGDLDLFIAPATHAWGFDQATGTIGIDFNSPAAFVRGQARAKGAGADAVLTALDANQQPCGTFPLPNDQFATFCFAGAITRLELTNNTAGTDAVVGEIAAQSFDVATIFNGTQGGVDFDGSAGEIVMPEFGAEPTRMNVVARILSAPGFRIAGSNNAIGVQGSETATISFQSPPRFLHILARGSDPASGFPSANATITTFDELGGMSVFPLNNQGFTLVSVSIPTVQVELANTAAGAIAVIGLLAQQGNVVHTRFAGMEPTVDFDAIANMPGQQFQLQGGLVTGFFEGTVLNLGEPTMVIAPSMNAFGIEGNGTATIMFPFPVCVVSGRARGSGPDTALPTASATLLARDDTGAELQSIALPTDAFATFSFSSDQEISSIEITNTVAGAAAVIGEITVVAVPDAP